MASQTAGDVTQLLVEWSNGVEEAEAKLIPLVYEELRRLAARYLRRERSDHTLQTTALVHEAYLRLVDQRRVEWRNSLHFYALAASMMRRILVDHARGRQVAKRGGGAPKLSLEDVPELSSERARHLTAVDEALTSLAEIDPELSKIVELRFFGGFGNSEVAELLGVSVPTVVRRWRLAKAWLFRYLDQGSTDAC